MHPERHRAPRPPLRRSALPLLALSLGLLACEPAPAPGVSSASAALTADRLVGAWGLAGTLADDSGHQNHATHVTGAEPDGPATAPRWETVEGRQALDFDGSTWLRVPDPTSVDAAWTGEVSLSAWVYARSHSDPERLSAIAARHEAGTAYQQFMLGLRDGYPIASVHFGDAVAPAQIPLRRWVHLAMTYDGLTAKVFQDGAAVVTLDIGWPIAPDTSPVSIGAGQSLHRMTNLFDGYLRDVRLYTRALAPAEIAALAH